MWLLIDPGVLLRRDGVATTLVVYSSTMATLDKITGRKERCRVGYSTSVPSVSLIAR